MNWTRDDFVKDLAKYEAELARLLDQGLPEGHPLVERQRRRIETTNRVLTDPRYGLTFAGEPGMTFDGDLDAQFAVDTGARTITGLAVPYGKTAKSDGRRFRFQRGAIKYGPLHRVKLLRDHDRSQALGKAIDITDTAAGMLITFKVSPGAAGDAALALAADQVLDGLSIGVDFSSADYRPDPQNPGAYLVFNASLREVSLTAVPAFDDSRLTSVRASHDGGHMDTCEHCGATLTPGVAHTCPTPPTVTPPERVDTPVTFTAEQFDRLLGRVAPAPAPTGAGPTQVDPTRSPSVTVTREPLPYAVRRTFNRITGSQEFIFSAANEHDFSTDLAAMAREKDTEGTRTEAGGRVMRMLNAQFAEVSTTSIDELTPEIDRPDMYVDQRDYRTPLMDMISRGAPPNGVQPFRFPKFNSATGLVADHTEGTEPSSGTFTTTSQLVNPTALSGKASLTREVWDMGGNPSVSGLVFNQMVRGYREGLETAAATFLNTLTAAADVTITTAATNKALVADLNAMVAELQFTRGYDFDAMAMEKVLYKAAAAAVDDSGRPLLPILSPMNANGTAATRFQTLNIAGVVGVPSWALASTAGSPNNSWLFDRSTVFGWWTPPQRLEFPGSDPGASSAPNAYAPVAYVDLAIWGYKAFANSDIGGVRQVIYDSVT